MRILFSVVGLLVVLAIVALLVSTQLGSAGSAPAVSNVEISAEQATDAANVQQLRQQLNSNPKAVQDAYQQSIEAQMDNTRNRMEALEAEAK